MTIGIKFGEYLLLERISRGGMAEIFKAKKFSIGGFEKTVAIKKILPIICEDPEFIKMLIDEANLVARLNHANICQIYELGCIEDSHFIVMEYIFGQNLLQIQKALKNMNQIMPISMMLFITTKICEALDYAHKMRDEKGDLLQIIHRDVSPQNILVSYEGEVKLIDFGIAKATYRSTHTRIGVLKGKLSYMSPEQVKGMPIDRRSDLFSLGILMFEMLTQRRLFLGENDFVTLENIKKAQVPPLRKFNPQIPKKLEQIVIQALSPNPKTRYQWASEILSELEEITTLKAYRFNSQMLSTWMKRVFKDKIKQEQAKTEEISRMYRESISLDKTKIFDHPSTLLEEEKKILKLEPRESVELLEVSPYISLSNTKKPKEVLAPFPPIKKKRTFLLSWPIPLIALGIFILSLIAITYYPSKTEAPPKITTGTIIVVSLPKPNANVFLKGKYKGKTPLKLKNLRSGKYKIILKDKGYKDTSFTVNLKPGKVKVLTAKLIPLPPKKAELQITSLTPNVSLYINGKKILLRKSGVVKLEPNISHKIKLTKLGFAPYIFTVKPKPGEKITKKIKFRPQKAPYPIEIPKTSPKSPKKEEKRYGLLEVNTVPWSKVIIDGKDTGRTTPITHINPLRLLQGRHIITFITATNQKYSYSVRIKAGKTLKIIKKLE